ncbi:MAG: hypothetical protein AAGI34_05660 [Pseudomonadota bacterium]
MRNAAMILGLIGGIAAMVVGFFGYGFAEIWEWIAGQERRLQAQTGHQIATQAGPPEEPWLTKLLALFGPVAAVTGAALAPETPRRAALLLAASVGAMVYGFGFGVFTMFPITLCAIAAVLAGLARRQDEEKS